MFGAMVEYWYYTGDDKWNEITTQALLHQVGDDHNYMPPNQTLSLGNDDQIFWGFAAISAAELKYPDPPKDQLQWLSLVQNLFDSQATRWYDSPCGDGLHWQPFEHKKGWSYKNITSSGGLFNAAARLARYTMNDTFTEWANKIWDWTDAVGFIGKDYHIFDGADISTNCSVINHDQHAYLPAVYLHGAANMYNITDGSNVWKERIEGIIGALRIFFPNNKEIMAQPCERGQCDLNSRSFKAYLARFMGATIPLAPFTEMLLWPKLRASALAAAEQCNGPDNACGLIWTDHTNYKSTTGIGE